MPAERSTKRHRGAVACVRCKSRKHRCDNEYPSCGACLAANSECEYTDGNHPTGYVRSLQNRLRALEHVVQSREAVTLNGAEEHLEAPPPDSALRFVRRHQETHTERDLRILPENDDQEAAVDAAALPSTPPYLGISSGYPLATMMQSTIDSPLHHGESAASSTWLPTQSTHGKSRRLRSGNEDNRVGSSTRTIMPGADISERLIAAYVNKVHTKHPFLSLQRIRKLGDQRHILRPASQTTPGAPPGGGLDHCTIHLVYAIGARYLQLSEEYDYRPPSDHYASALVDVKMALAGRSLESLEVMILLSIYQLRSPSEPGIWSAIGATVRQAVDRGLHRASKSSALLDQRRKRIFWTIYMLERSVAVTLGRPFCLSERDIDIDLPANVPEEITDEQEMIKAIEDARSGPSKIYAVSPALHIFRLHRIISRIQHTVHRVDRSPSSIDTTKITHLREALLEWRAGIVGSVPLTDEHEAPNPYVTQSYHILQYHKATLFLLLPTLTWISTTHSDFQACATAAGQIGQLYKNLYNTQRVRISYSLLALHANLIAGLTLVYCFVADRTIFDADFSRGLRACSTVLYIIAERWPAARKARDCLERFVQATVERNDAMSGDSMTETATILNAQQRPPQADASSSMVHTAVQANQLGLEDLPQPDGIWDMLGSVLGEGESGWFDGFGSQDFMEFS